MRNFLRIKYNESRKDFKPRVQSIKKSKGWHSEPLKVGDTVRILLDSKTFSKSARDPNWSAETYEVVKLIQKSGSEIIRYILKDHKSKFYRHDLLGPILDVQTYSKAKPDDEFQKERKVAIVEKSDRRLRTKEGLIPELGRLQLPKRRRRMPKRYEESEEEVLLRFKAVAGHDTLNPVGRERMKIANLFSADIEDRAPPDLREYIFKKINNQGFGGFVAFAGKIKNEDKFYIVYDKMKGPPVWINREQLKLLTK